MHTLSLLAPSLLVETLSDALMFELDARSVSVDDADAGTDAECALFGEPGTVVEAAWPRSAVTALFDDAESARRAADHVLGEDWARDIAFAGIGALPDTDWVRATQAQFDPVAITPGFWIVPSWHAVPAQATRVIRLDPGLAFGSGTHPTTRMCLRWIARHADAIEARRVLDYGCGSGILAIAAALHGAAVVDATDIDDAALVATRDNARANGMQAGLCVGAPDRFTGCYDIVLANILATPLRLLAPVLVQRLERGAHLVLAGLLARQADELQAAYAPAVRLAVDDEDDGWVLLAGRASEVDMASSPA
jgi:ribosomal protein L11 methyltransferase